MKITSEKHAINYYLYNPEVYYNNLYKCDIYSVSAYTMHQLTCSTQRVKMNLGEQSVNGQSSEHNPYGRLAIVSRDIILQYRVAMAWYTLHSICRA